MNRNTCLLLESLNRDYLHKAHIGYDRDIYKLANEMGFDIRKVKFRPDVEKTIEGILLVDENKANVDNFSTNKGIGLNVNNAPNVNRFTVAHELSHYIFQKMTQKNFDDKIFMSETRLAHDPTHSREFYEQIIDYMAAALLMPIKSFREQYDELKNVGLLDEDIIAELSLFYGLPPIAISKRISEIKDIDG